MSNHPCRTIQTLALVAATLVPSACGRIGFDNGAADGDGGASDAPPTGAADAAAPDDGLAPDAGVALAITRVETFGSDIATAPNDAVIGSDGTVYVVGGFEGTLDVGTKRLVSNGTLDMYAVAVDPSGFVRYAVSFGAGLTDHANHVIVSADGSVDFICLFEGTVNFDQAGTVQAMSGDDTAVVGLDPDGNALWVQHFGTTSDTLDSGGLAFAPMNGVVVGSEFQNTMDTALGPVISAGGADVFVARLNLDGGLQAIDTFGGPGMERAHHTTVDQDGNTLIIGEMNQDVDLGGGTLPHQGEVDAFILAASADGAHVWSHSLGGAGPDTGRRLIVGPDGTIYAVGDFFESMHAHGTDLVSAGGVDGFLSAYQSDGTPHWTRGYGGAGTDVIRDLIVDRSGRLVITGDFTQTVDLGGGPLENAGGEDIFLAVLAPDGTHLWSTRFGGTGNDHPDSLMLGPDGSVVLVGQFQDNVQFGEDTRTAPGTTATFVVRLDIP